MFSKLEIIIGGFLGTFKYIFQRLILAAYSETLRRFWWHSSSSERFARVSLSRIRSIHVDLDCDCPDSASLTGCHLLREARLDENIESECGWRPNEA
jgi:hypothetical protein